MAQVQYLAIFLNEDKPYEKIIGFDTAEILYYGQSNNEKVTFLVLCKNGVKDIVYVYATFSEFERDKKLYDQADRIFYPGQNN